MQHATRFTFHVSRFTFHVSRLTFLLLFLCACSTLEPAATPTDLPSPTATHTPKATHTVTLTATAVAATDTATPTPSLTATPSPTPTSTATLTHTPTPTHTPTSTATPTPSLTPTLIQRLPPTSTPTPVDAPPTATPAPASRVQLVLAMPAGSDMPGASQALDAVRRRGVRTLSFLSLQNHPDFVRLSIADGHLPGLYLDEGMDPAAQVAGWEALLARVMGALPYRLAMLAPDVQDGATVQALEGWGYTVVRAEGEVTGAAGQVVGLVLGQGGAGRLASLAAAAMNHGLGLGPHVLAEAANARPFSRPPQATTLPEFQARYLIVLDPGHTRADNGTPIYPPVGKAVLERWAVLERAYAWQKLLDAEGWVSVLTHDDDSLFDVYTRTPDTVDDGQNSRRDDLQYRANLCYYLGVRTGRTPVVISLHVDSLDNPAVVGPLTFYAAHGDLGLIAAGQQLAEEMHNELAHFWADQGIDAPGRGVLHSDTYAWDRFAEAGYTLIGNRFTLPAPGAQALPTDVYIAVLIEAGVATHPAEAQVLATVEGNVLLAEAHHRAFTRWVTWMLAKQAEPPG